MLYAHAHNDKFVLTYCVTPPRLRQKLSPSVALPATKCHKFYNAHASLDTRTNAHQRTPTTRHADSGDPIALLTPHSTPKWHSWQPNEPTRFFSFLPRIVSPPPHSNSLFNRTMIFHKISWMSIFDPWIFSEKWQIFFFFIKKITIPSTISEFHFINKEVNIFNRWNKSNIFTKRPQICFKVDIFLNFGHKLQVTFLTYKLSLFWPSVLPEYSLITLL